MAETSKPGRNGYDPEKVAAFYERIENLYSDLATERGEYMAKCKAIREDITDVIDEAKDVAGIPKKVMKAVIKQQQLLEKAEGVRTNLEDLADEFDQLKHALGLLEDTPLGQAALASVGNGADAEAHAGA